MVRALTKPLAAALVLFGLFSAGIGIGKANGYDLADFLRAPDKAPPREFPVLSPSNPIRISIPSIGVKAPVQGVGLDPEGVVDTPALTLKNEAGWYRKGPSPGEFGPAIIVGHVDTKDRPAVFAKLKDMNPGDTIEVVRRDRTTAVFEVNSVERFNKAAIPVDRIYHDFTRPSLRLITCGGRWVGGETGYEDNVVVFASLVSSRKN